MMKLRICLLPFLAFTACKQPTAPVVQPRYFWDSPAMSYEQALAESKKTAKPMLLYFTGWSCVNCRKMEENVLMDEKVKKSLGERFICTSFYVDDKTPLPENEHTVSKTTGKEIKTVGQKHNDLQVAKFQTNAQPFFAIVDSNENQLGMVGYQTGKDHFIKFVDEALPAKALGK